MPDRQPFVDDVGVRSYFTEPLHLPPPEGHPFLEDVGLRCSPRCGGVVAATRRNLPGWASTTGCGSHLVGRSACGQPGCGEVLVAPAVGEVVEPLAAHELDGGTGTVAGGAVDDVAARLVEGADALIEIGS